MTNLQLGTRVRYKEYGDIGVVIETRTTIAQEPERQHYVKFNDYSCWLDEEELEPAEDA